MKGKESILATFGPLCASRETINLFMKVIIDTQPWRYDPSLTVKPWDPYKLDGHLKIAIEWSDGVVKPHPPLIRAMKKVAEACKAAGMEIVDWEPLEHKRAWDITSALYFPDGGEDTMRPLLESGEPILPLTDFIIKDQARVKPLTMHEYWKVRTLMP